MASQTCPGQSPNAAAFLDEYFFTSDYTVELQEVCCRAGVKLDPSCIIHFSPNNSVLAYGGVQRGGFVADPSIAGIGVLLSFLPTVLVNFLAVVYCFREFQYRRRYIQEPNVLAKFLVDPPDWLHAALKTLLVSASDTQLILALVYGINFGISGKCTISAYHYNVAIGNMVVALTCLTLSVYMLPDYWEARVASALRVIVTFLIFAFLLRFLAYQFQTAISPDPMFAFRRSSTDSSLFLPIACFLDPELNPFKGLSEERIAKVGGIGPRFTPELFFSIALALCYLVAIGTRFRYRKNTARPPLALTVAVVLICGFSCCWCLGHTFLIWFWVDRSGWMKTSGGPPGSLTGNPEMNPRAPGQILPLATMVWVIIMCFDAKPSRSDSKRALYEP